MKEYAVPPLSNPEKVEDTISYKLLNAFKNEKGETLDDYYDTIMKKYDLKKDTNENEA